MIIPMTGPIKNVKYDVELYTTPVKYAKGVKYLLISKLIK